MHLMHPAGHQSTRATLEVNHGILFVLIFLACTGTESIFVISIQAAVCLNTPTCLTDKTNCVSTFVKVKQQGRKL